MVSLGDMLMDQMITEQFQKQYMDTAHSLAMRVLQSNLYADPEVRDDVDFILEYKKIKDAIRKGKIDDYDLEPR